MIYYCNLNGNPKCFLNMDETEVYLNSAPNRTIHSKAESKISIMVGRSLLMRFTFAVTMTMDGIEFRLFVTFNVI